MKPICLLLLTERGDELGRLQLGAVQVAPAGTSGGEAAHPALSAQMDTLYAEISTALAQEGMEAALDPIDLQIAVSRALIMARTDGSEVFIPLPVRPSGAGQSVENGPEDSPLPVPGILRWNDLFDLNQTEEER